MGKIISKNNSLTEHEIIKYLKDFRKDSRIDYPQNGKLRIASVLVPMLKISTQWHLLYTRRTDTLQFHKGQVSFPGGVNDPGDLNPTMTALREAYEEIDLKPEFVKILGNLPVFNSLTYYQITPVVGRIRSPVELKPNPDEVKRIFTIPLQWLAENENREWRPYQSSDGTNQQVIFYKPYDGEILWGITARITVTLINALHLIK